VINTPRVQDKKDGKYKAETEEKDKDGNGNAGVLANSMKRMAADKVKSPRVSLILTKVDHETEGPIFDSSSRVVLFLLVHSVLN
jgi:hypothetical protein